jgi:phage terminase large subunit-like protein
MFSVRSADFHHEIARAFLDRAYRKINILAPRGHAKSSIIAGIGVLHHLVHRPGPRFIVLVSKTEGHAIKLLQTIKDTLEFSAHFRSLYGYWGRQTARSWKQTEVELVDPRNPTAPIYILVRGAEQQMRGLKYIHQRPTLVIYDDPEDEKNTKTDQSRENNLNGLLKGIVPGLHKEQAHPGRVVVIGTPIHEKGMVNVLASMRDWKTFHYQALIPRDNVDTSDPLLPEKERYDALWPEVWPVEELLKIRDDAKEAGKISWFYSEYQCEIVGDADQLFRPDYFGFWEGELKFDANHEAYLDVTALARPGCEMVKTAEKIPVNVFMGVDPASSTKNTADFSVIFVIAMDASKRIFCVDYFRQRVRPMQLADAIVTYYKRFHPKKTQIETVGYQEMIRDYLRTHVDEHIPGLEIKNNSRKGKPERLESLQPDFALGKVFLKPTMTHFQEELIVFPRGRHDDTLDGFFYAKKGSYRPYHEVVGAGGVESKKPERKVLDWMVI